MLNLETPRGEVIAIGHFATPKIPELSFNFEIPNLPFIVIERKTDTKSRFKWNKGAFIATCIQMQIDGYGATISEAYKDAAYKTLDYIYGIFKNPTIREEAWENLFGFLRPNEDTNILLEKYYALQIELAKKDKLKDEYSEYDSTGVLIEIISKQGGDLGDKARAFKYTYEIVENTLIKKTHFQHQSILKKVMSIHSQKAKLLEYNDFSKAFFIISRDIENIDKMSIEIASAGLKATIGDFVRRVRKRGCKKKYYRLPI